MNQFSSKIWIIIIALVVVAGGFFAWQYFGMGDKKESNKPPPIIEVSEVNLQNYIGEILLRDNQ